MALYIKSHHTYTGPILTEKERDLCFSVAAELFFHFTRDSLRSVLASLEAAALLKTSCT